MATFKKHVLVEIEFEYDEKRKHQTLDDNIHTAVHLAVEPNFGTIEEGVHLLHVRAAFNQQTINFEPK